MTLIRYRCDRHSRGGAAVGWSAPRPAPRRPPSSLPTASIAPPESAPASSGDRVVRALEGLCILSVEDNDDARELISLILLGAGARVLNAASAAEGFHVLHESHPQLLVSDIGMPDEDGYSLMRRIRALPCCDGGDILSMALSAFTRPEDRMRALRAGFTIHVAKPVHPSQLVSALANLAALLVHRCEPRPAH